MLLAAVGLLLLGVVMVNSAGLSLSTEASLSPRDVLLGRTTQLAALAMVLMMIGSWVPIWRLSQWRGWRSPTWWLTAICAGSLALLYVPGVGRTVNGALRWVQIGPVGFQPSEIVKWVVPVMLATYAGRRAATMGRFTAGVLIPMTIVGILCAVIATEDLGTAVLVGTVSAAMLVAAGAPVWHMLLPAPAAVAGFVWFVMSSPYRLDRLRAFIDPYQDPQGIGYHVIQSMAAIGGGGLAGRGLGNSVQKFGYLPEDTTDFIFAIICEELGVAGAVLVVALYAMILLAGVSICRRAVEPFERLVCLGVTLTIGVQAVINMAVVTGSVPTKGIALPLISAGGTGWALTAFCIGLVVSIDRHRAARLRDRPIVRAIDPRATQARLADRTT